MLRAAQVELMEVQRRGNHGTLSAQLHNEKSNLLAVSILDIMFRVPVAEPLAPSARVRPPQFPHTQGTQPGREKGTKQLINMLVSKKYKPSCATSKEKTLFMPYQNKSNR